MVWEHSDIAWASRWDLYLYMGDDQVHWFSILNSLVIVFLLSGIGTLHVAAGCPHSDFAPAETKRVGVPRVAVIAPPTVTLLSRVRPCCG